MSESREKQDQESEYPNAEVLRAFSRDSGDVKKKLADAEERQREMLSQLYALQNAHELNMKRLEGLEKAAQKRKRTPKKDVSDG